MTTTFIVSPGNTEKKYALFSDGVCVLEMSYECHDRGYSLNTRSIDGRQSSQVLSQEEFKNAFSHASAEAATYVKKSRLDDVTQIVVRVAVAGTFFQRHARVTDEYVQELKNKEILFPLQVGPLLREIKYCKEVFPKVEVFAASDSAFYSTLPAHAREYSLSPELIKSLDLYKFGINGLSVSSVVGRIHSVLGIDPERMVVCHIGNNTSVTAVQNGKSVDTTVGFNPSGFPSGNQAGDVDTAACLQVMKSKNLRATEAELFLNTQGGFQAMADTSDVQVLFKKMNQNDEAAKHTLQLFTYKIQQAIASSVAALGGLDVLVFTGNCGVRSPELRSLILQNLAFLQIRINDERNSVMMGRDGVISERNSVVKVAVFKGDQMSEMNGVIKKIQLDSVHKSSAA